MDDEWRRDWDSLTPAEQRSYFPLLAGAVGVAIGFIIGLMLFTGEGDRKSYLINIFSSLLSIIVTVGVINVLNERRAIRLEKRRLVLQMGSPIRENAVEAARILRGQGWGFNGDKTLEHARFPNANLEGVHLTWSNLRTAYFGEAILNRAILDYSDMRGAYLSNAKLENARLNCVNLEGAYLDGCNLHAASFGALVPDPVEMDFMLPLDAVGLPNIKAKNLPDRTNLRRTHLYQADLREVWFGNVDLSEADLGWANLDGAQWLTDRELAVAKRLIGAIMPDGKRYNGRFNLESDLEFARNGGVDTSDPAAMAAKYEVTLEDYLIGQAWARENLAELRGNLP